jgi:hypothetical protein
MSDARLAKAGSAAFALYGLSDDFSGPRTVLTVGSHGDVVNSVTLGHGAPANAGEPWVQVTVMGPLRGRSSGGGTWSIDPLPMIASELLGAAGAVITSQPELARGVGRALGTVKAGQLRLDERLETFAVLREGDAWAAHRELPSDHLLWVVARGIEPDAVTLEQVRDLAAYTVSGRP